MKQLEILAKLRNLQELAIKISEKMALVYDLETDVRYRQDIEQGLEEGIGRGIEQGTEQGRLAEREESVLKMIGMGLLSHTQIAEIAEMFVEKAAILAQR